MLLYNRLTHDGNLTTSLLHFTPKIVDQDRVLSCVADNGVFKAENKSVALNVYFVPVVHAEITNSVDPVNIREGDDLEMECKIQVRFSRVGKQTELFAHSKMHLFVCPPKPKSCL